MKQVGTQPKSRSDVDQPAARQPGRLRRVLKWTALGSAALSGTCVIGTGIGAAVVHSKASKFPSHASKIPCRPLQLPNVLGAEELERHLCISIAGEQPRSVGVEVNHLPDGRTAYTLFLTWPHDGPLESLKLNRHEDAEPITLIIGEGPDGLKQVRVRSHWVVGACNVVDMHQFADGRVAVTIQNGFHTPTPIGCNPQPVEPLVYVKGADPGRPFVFNRVQDWAKAAGTDSVLADEYEPLDTFTENTIPGPNHSCRSQPTD